MKVYIIMYQLYDVVNIEGVYFSKEKCDAGLEEIRQQSEKDYPGCWELGGWKEERDWSQGGKIIKVRNGDAFKNLYWIEKHEAE